MADFWECSLWEFHAAVDGWNKANTPKGKGKNPGMSAEEYDAYLERKGYR